MGMPIRADRAARYADWKLEVASDAGREKFLQELAGCGSVAVFAKSRDLPRERVGAFLAEHAELNEQAKEALVAYTNQLAADVIAIADELVDEEITLDRREVLRAAAKLRSEARKWLTSKWNRPVYGDAVQVQHTGETVVRLTFGERTIAGGATVPLVGESSVVPADTEDWI